MAVVRSSILTDNEGLTWPRQLWICALNQRAPLVLADLDDTVFPEYRDYRRALSKAAGTDELIVEVTVAGWQSKMKGWMERHNLSTNYGPGNWWELCIEHTLEYWLTTGKRKLVPPPGSDSILEKTKTFALMIKAVVPTLRSMVEPAWEHAYGAISKKELAQRYGHAAGTALLEELDRYERKSEAIFAPLKVTASPAPTGPSSGLQLSFEPADAEAAVRHQVLRETFDQIAEYDPRDPSHLRKVVQEFLKSLGITPRPRRSRNR